MPNFRYSFKDYDKNNMARVAGLDLPISTKHSIEICSFIRKMDLQKAKSYLDEVVSKRKAIPFRRFNKDMGHKKGIGPGRYPVKASTEFIRLLNSVETNAQSKGLNTGNLMLVHVSAHQASRPMKSGRHRGRVMKRSHVEIVVKEAEVKKERSRAKPEPKVKPTKAEAKADEPVSKKQERDMND